MIWLHIVVDFGLRFDGGCLLQFGGLFVFWVLGYLLRGLLC